MDLERLSPRCYLCSSRLSLSELLAKKAEFKHKAGFLQLFDHREEIVARLLPAYFNALIRKEDGLMKSKEVANEMLCLAAGEMNVGKAIKKAGIRENSGFIIFASDKLAAKGIKALFELDKMKRIELELDADVASEVAAAPLLEN